MEVGTVPSIIKVSCSGVISGSEARELKAMTISLLQFFGI